jgi:hypothetical protein
VKLFGEKCLDQIEYFEFLTTASKHDILYKLKKVNYEKGGFLYKLDEEAKHMFII